MPPAGSRKWRNCYLAVVERLLEQCLVYMHVVYVWACVCVQRRIRSISRCLVSLFLVGRCVKILAVT